MKKIVFVVCIFLIPVLLFAETEKPMVIRTHIPEDYGVSFPEGAMRLDHMVFQLQLETGTETLFEKDGIFTLSSLSSGEGSLSLSLLYYGNQSERFSAIIKVEVGDGWIGKMGERSIPITVVFEEKEEREEGIESKELGEGVLEMSVLPQGPRNGVEFANLNFIWSLGRNEWAGDYEAVVNISMEVI